MPRPKGEPKGLLEEDQEQADEMLDLLKWVARSIVTINMAGKKMTNKCRLCDPSRLHKEPCRHEEVWRLAGEQG